MLFCKCLKYNILSVLNMSDAINKYFLCRLSSKMRRKTCGIREKLIIFAADSITIDIMITNRFLQRLPRLSYRLKIALPIVSGVVVGLGRLFLYLLRFHTYLGDDPSACVNCHIMTPYYATWMHGAHARNTTCNDCHVPHDNVFRKYFFKGKDGMNHVYKFVTRQERQAIRAIDESAEVIMENCVRCHATLNTELVNTGRITYMDVKCDAGKACWDCHRDVAHGKMNSLSSTPAAEVPLPDTPVPDWLQKMME